VTGPPRTPADRGAEGAYNAYTAYSYLAAGEDFRRFELAPEFGRVAPYAAGLTAEQERRSRRLLTDSIVISLHDHPVRYPLRMEETPAYNRTGRQHAAYAGLAASGMTVVFDNMMDGTACVTGNAPWRWDDVVTDLGMRQADLAHFRYCIDLVGIDHVAFGPDTLYGDHARLHQTFARLLSLDAARGPAFEPVAYVDGMENPTENFTNICGWLVRHGFDDDAIRAVLGGNVYRALQAVWVGP
jgi:hypothetical protein